METLLHDSNIELQQYDTPRSLCYIVKPVQDDLNVGIGKSYCRSPMQKVEKDDVEDLRKRFTGILLDVLTFADCDLTDCNLTFLKCRELVVTDCKVDGVILPQKVNSHLALRNCEALSKPITLPKECKLLSIGGGCYYGGLLINSKSHEIKIEQTCADLIDLTKSNVSQLYLDDNDCAETLCPERLEYMQINRHDMNNIQLPKKAFIDANNIINIDPRTTWIEEGIPARFLVCGWDGTREIIYGHECIENAPVLKQVGSDYSAGCVGPFPWDLAMEYLSKTRATKKHHTLFRHYLLTNPPSKR